MKILTIDVEEWFQGFEDVYSNGQYINFEMRIYDNVERIFRLLESTNSKATFFVVGWIAKEYPDLVKRISERYEIGSHSFSHRQVSSYYNKDEFRNDVSSSINLLEDITGKRVKYFRAPGFSLTKNQAWAFEVLVENGIEIDCSFKANSPSIISYNGIEIKEMPINYYSLFWRKMIFSGGGYFRLYPYSMIKYLVENSDYCMSYFHPRDIDKEQPMKNISLNRKFRSNVGINIAENKIENLLNDFKFIDIQEADNLIDWNSCSKIFMKQMF